MSRRHAPGRQDYLPDRRARHPGLSSAPSPNAANRQGMDTREPSRELAASAALCPGPAEPADGPDPQTLGARRALQSDRDAQQFALRLIPTLAEQDLKDLRRLLGDSLTRLPAGERRQHLLGLLVRLLEQSGGLLPRVSDYNAARQQAEARGGEQWPAASTLIAVYGGWPEAVRVAARHATYGSRARVASQPPQMSPRAYTPTECRAAVLRCRETIDGTWPTQAEFECFCETERALAARHGRPDPRAPVRKAWLRCYGDWPSLLDESQREARPDAA